MKQAEETGTCPDPCGALLHQFSCDPALTSSSRISRASSRETFIACIASGLLSGTKLAKCSSTPTWAGEGFQAMLQTSDKQT